MRLMMILLLLSLTGCHTYEAVRVHGPGKAVLGGLGKDGRAVGKTVGHGAKETGKVVGKSVKRVDD